MSAIGRDLARWDGFATHRTGTADDAATARWLVAELDAVDIPATPAGFDFVRRWFPDAHIALDGRRIAADPCLDGGATPPDGLRGPLLPLDAGTGIGVTRFAPFDGHPSTRALEATRRNGRHQAIIAITDPTTVEAGLAPVNAESWAQPYGPPVLQVSSTDGAAIDAALRAGRDVRVVAAERLEPGTAWNVEARIPGREPDLAPLVVMTPRSGWWVCTAERGGGILAWLAIARAFAAVSPRRPVVLTANTGHELGHVGLDRFLDSHPGLVHGAHAWLHLGANFIARGATLRLQASDDGLMQGALAAFAAAGERVDEQAPIGVRPLGEARNIHDGGGRFVSMLASQGRFHHPDDRLDGVDMARAARTTTAWVAIARALADA